MKITLVENGPIIVKAEAEVSVRVGVDAKTTSDAIALCRCGQSSKKPFCDGSHNDAEFKASAGELNLVK
jgi:CDGSH-type Zn-finger protein